MDNFDTIKKRLEWTQRNDRLSDFYRNRAKEFLEIAFSKSDVEEDVIHCPCKKCDNCLLKTWEDIEEDLIVNGIVRNYVRSTFHGEYPSKQRLNIAKNCVGVLEDGHDNMLGMIHDLIQAENIFDNIDNELFDDDHDDGDFEHSNACDIDLKPMLISFSILIRMPSRNFILVVSDHTVAPFFSRKSLRVIKIMDAQQLPDPPLQSPSQHQTPAMGDDMIACVASLEAALLPCLPARELQAIDRSSHPSHQIDVERHARDFMEAAKKLQLYFIGLQHEDQPSKLEMLQKVILFPAYC
ncbi:hypothetical protein Dimus_016196 [Dionaea muscipula]